MKNETSSLEFYYLLKEFQVLVDAKVDRVYHSKDSPQELVIGFHVTNIGKKFLIINLPGIIYIDDTKDPKDVPTGLCMMLRKYLEGKRLRKIIQKDFERVIELEFEGKEDKYYLTIEMFGKGNIIFCDSEYKILNTLEEHEWKDRKVARNETYLVPKSQFNALTITEKEFSEAIKNSGKESLVKAIAITLSLGGIYAEELCFSSKISKDTRIVNVTQKEFTTLYTNLKELFNKKPQSNFSNGAIYPFTLETIPLEKTYDTFNEAIRQNHQILKNSKKSDKHKENTDKIKKVIEDQEKLLQEAQDSYEEFQKKGEAIYTNYQLIDEILKTVKDARKKYTAKEIKDIISKSKYSKIIKDINNTEITLEIDEHK